MSLFKRGLSCTMNLKHALARLALPRKSDADEFRADGWQPISHI